jgi:hypothetical protein
MTAIDIALRAADNSVPIHYFTGVNNVGDLLNPFLVSRLFGVRTHLAVDPSLPHLIGIGSFIQTANQQSHVWGTGAISSSSKIADLDVDKIHALRGKLSHNLLSSSGLKLRDMPLGDPGFLVGRLEHGVSPSKKSRLGIAPHYVDRQHPWVNKLLANPDVIDLNVHRPVEEFLTAISSCEAVVSSSLHGLIVAEALGIPNVWIKLSDDVIGDGFKFRDWFSLANRPQNEPELPIDGAAEDIVAELCDRARLHEMQINRQELVDAFPLESVQVARPARTQRVAPLAEMRGLNPQFFKADAKNRPQQVVDANLSEPFKSGSEAKVRYSALRVPLFAPFIGSKVPVVSCVMVTANRPEQARLSVECYRRQSWQNRRLYILDTGTDDGLERWLQQIKDPSINFKRISRGAMTLGDIRNAAIQRTRGDYVCIWDDDDLHHPLRVEGQMTATAKSRTDGCMLSRLMIWWPFQSQLVVSDGKYWEGTLLAKRDAMASYASLNRGEDSKAVHAMQERSRIVYVNAPELYIYVKHLNNTWSERHFEYMRQSATIHFSAGEYDGALARLRSVFPIDDYMDAIRL